MDAGATAGGREFYCRYKFRINNVDVLQDLDGQDFLDIEPVAMKLEQVGPTVISSDGKYSEDTTIRVTAVDATTGATISGFAGTVNIAEIPTSDGIKLYSQNTPNGANLPSSVSITTDGSVTFVAKSLAGPRTEGSAVLLPPFGEPPLNATIQTTNYPVWHAANLTIPQWITSGPVRIDPLSRGQVYDWFQTRARDAVAKATAVLPPNGLAVVMWAVDGYTVSPIQDAGWTPLSHSGMSQITINPYYNVFRTDTLADARCGFTWIRGFQGIFFHEARHAYQMAQATPGNDPDQDYLVDIITVPANDSVPPGNYFLDTDNPRFVCNKDAFPIGNGAQWQPQQAVFAGGLIPDAFVPLVGYALEMDAYAFAAYWAK